MISIDASSTGFRSSSTTMPRIDDASFSFLSSSARTTTGLSVRSRRGRMGRTSDVRPAIASQTYVTLENPGWRNHAV
jgi:hypothetical protein